MRSVQMMTKTLDERRLQCRCTVKSSSGLIEEMLRSARGCADELRGKRRLRETGID